MAIFQSTFPFLKLSVNTNSPFLPLQGKTCCLEVLFALKRGCFFIPVLTLTYTSYILFCYDISGTCSKILVGKGYSQSCYLQVKERIEIIFACFKKVNISSRAWLVTFEKDVLRLTQKNTCSWQKRILFYS